MSAPFPKKISQILPTFQNVAQTSHYLVKFGIPGGSLRRHLSGKGVDYRFHLDEIGLLCSGASLPGSTFATETVTGEYQGVTEVIPHTRNFTRIKLEFYVDNEYKALKFLEHWMEYITGGSSANPLESAYNFKLNYPEQYRSESTKIVKFEKNYRQSIEYNFKGLYPLALDSTRVQYQRSQVLKASCSFAYERYVCGKASSFSQRTGTNENFVSDASGRFGNRQGNINQINALNETAVNNNEVVNQINKVGQQTISGQDGFKYDFESTSIGDVYSTFK